MNTRLPAQRGASLFIAMVALLALTIAGLALVRSMDTASLLAGNYAFRLGALNAAEVGVEDTLGALDAIVGSATRDATQNDIAKTVNGRTLHCKYLPSYDPANDNSTSGLPGSGVVSWGSLTATSLSLSGYSYKCAIERMCKSGTTVTASNLPMVCMTNQISDSALGSSKLASQTGTLSGTAYETGFRITIQLTGPRGTTAYVQAMMMKYMPPV